MSYGNACSAIKQKLHKNQSAALWFNLLGEGSQHCYVRHRSADNLKMIGSAISDGPLWVRFGNRTEVIIKWGY